MGEATSERRLSSIAKRKALAGRECALAALDSGARNPVTPAKTRRCTAVGGPRQVLARQWFSGAL